MKTVTRLTIMIAALFISTISYSQVQIGARAGLTYSDMSSGSFAFDAVQNILPHPKRLLGTDFGITAEFPINSQLSFMSGLHYVSKGFSLKEQINIGGELPIPIGATVNARIHYLDVPLTMKYAFGQEGGIRPFVKAGATVGYASSAKLETKARVIIPINIATIPVGLNSSLYNRFEVGAMIGAGVEIPMGAGKLMIDAQYTHGMSSLVNTPIVDVKARNNAFGIGIGYSIPLQGGFRGA